MLGFGIKSTGTNYYEGDFLTNCSTGISMSATAKERAITTGENVPIPITGGVDVDKYVKVSPALEILGFD